MNSMGIYKRLGVKKYINAAATLTVYGGSLMPPEVVDAMGEAAGSFVDLFELHEKVGDRIAALTHNEAAFVPNGAATGLMLATAAAIAGADPEKQALLPFTDGLKNEVVLSEAGRVRYDYAIKMAGGRYVPFGDKKHGTAEQLEAAITAKTAAIFVFYFEHKMTNQPDFADYIRIAKKYDVPLFVDAAAQLPRRENLWRYTAEGADLAIFSGGKGLRGPQASGLMVGKRKWIDIIRGIASPNPGFGRPMKVGKEEIIGLLRAVELFMETDETETLAGYERDVERVVEAFAGVPGVTVTRDFPSEAGQPMPWALIKLQPGAFDTDATGILAELKAGEPGILLSGHNDFLHINPQTLEAGELDIIIRRLKEVLDANRISQA